MTRLLPLLLVMACTSGREDTGPTLDTGWFSSVGDTGGCVDQVKEIAPKQGEDAWYWRNFPRVKTTSALPEAYPARLLDGLGAEVETTPAWRGESFELRFEGGLRPSADYQLEVADCDGTERVSFRTSAYGEPLSGPPASLNGKTWFFDMSKANWIEPAGFGSVLALYFNQPILIGAQWADASMLDLMGAIGYKTDLGQILQHPSQASWDFPAADFTERPFFRAYADKVRFEFDKIPIDVYDFSLSATLAADGSSMGGARVSGLGDTRNMGELVGKKGDQRALCDLAATFAVACQPCPDGGGYCMQLTAIDAYGSLVPGLSLRQVIP